METATVTRSATVPETPAAPQASPLRLWGGNYVKPIVVKLKGKKKKRKYSGSLKPMQKGMRTSTKASDKFLNALSAGLTKYRKRQDRSSRKKKDGALKDWVRNTASGLGTTLRKSSKVPSIWAKSMTRRQTRRGVRFARFLMGGR